MTLYQATPLQTYSYAMSLVHNNRVKPGVAGTGPAALSCAVSYRPGLSRHNEIAVSLC